jgi:hypothetical protein
MQSSLTIATTTDRSAAAVQQQEPEEQATDRPETQLLIGKQQLPMI